VIRDIRAVRISRNIFMSGTSSSGPAPDALELAALLCSRVCHDLISPVGAIVNGLEVLDDNPKPEDREFALDLIRKSAKTASARLQFCRLAFGAAGSSGAQIDLGDAQTAYRYGLVQRVVPRERLYAEAEAFARKIIARPPQLVALARRAVHEGAELSLGQAIALESRLAERALLAR